METLLVFGDWKAGLGVKTHTYSSTQRVGVGAEATNLTPRDQMLRSDWSTESYLTPPQTYKSNTLHEEAGF